MIVQDWRVADPLHLPIAAYLQKRRIEPQEGLVGVQHLLVATGEPELLPDRLLAGGSTTLGEAPAPEWPQIELDQPAVGELTQTSHSLSHLHPGGAGDPFLARDADATQSVQDDEIGIGSMWQIHLVGVEGLEPPTPGL